MVSVTTHPIMLAQVTVFEVETAIVSFGFDAIANWQGASFL